MGWSKWAWWVVAAPLGLSLAPFACGSAASATDTRSGSAAGSNAGGGASAGSGAGHAAGRSADQAVGGAGAEAGEGNLAGSSGIGGTSAAAANVFVSQLRLRDGCLPRAFPIAQVPGGGFEAGQIRCGLSLATQLDADAPCACDSAQKLTPSSPGVAKAIAQGAERSGSCGEGTDVDCEQLCVCDLAQSSGIALRKCQSDAATPIEEQPPGFCYVDLNATPPLGNAALVDMCPTDARRSLRILGLAPTPEPLMFLACPL